MYSLTTPTVALGVKTQQHFRKHNICSVVLQNVSVFSEM